MTLTECIACWLCECAKFFFIFLGVVKCCEVLEILHERACDALLRFIAKRRARRQAAAVRRRRRQPITVR